MFKMESTENPIEWKYWWNESKFESIFSSFSFNYFQRTKPHYSDFIFKKRNTHTSTHFMQSKQFCFITNFDFNIRLSVLFHKMTRKFFSSTKKKPGMCAFSLIFFFILGNFVQLFAFEKPLTKVKMGSKSFSKECCQ